MLFRLHFNLHFKNIVFYLKYLMIKLVLDQSQLPLALALEYWIVFIFYCGITIESYFIIQITRLSCIQKLFFVFLWMISKNKQFFSFLHSKFRKYPFKGRRGKNYRNSDIKCHVIYIFNRVYNLIFSIYIFNRNFRIFIIQFHFKYSQYIKWFAEFNL